MKKIGITINGTIRDIFDKFDTMYRKIYIKNPGLVKMNENYEFVGEDDDDDSEFKRLEILTNSKIHLPMTTYDLRNHYSFESKESFEKFLYTDCVLELFGTSYPIPKAMDAANKIQFLCEEKKWFNVILIGGGNEQEITPTYYFLTKNACRIRQVLFTDSYEEMWQMCDAIITENPNILSSIPDNKKAIKIEKLYNSNVVNNKIFNSFDSLTQILSENLLEKLYKSL